MLDDAARPFTARREARLDLRAVSHAPARGRWRTEAMRSHPTPRLLVVTRGQGRVTVAGLTSGYGPNNLVFVPAGTMYGLEVGPGVHAQIVSLPDALAGDWPAEPAHLRLRDVWSQKELSQILDQLEAELRSTRPGNMRAAHLHAGLLAIFFQRQLAARGTSDPRHDTSQARLVAAFTALVERHFHTPRGIADYASELGVTATHLTRCCNATCGRSAHALLADRILFEARRLLHETDAPVNEIAARLGFSSHSYFSRAFQAATGQTPGDFRRQDPPVTA